MPWMFSSGGSMIITLLASLGIMVALVQTGWGLIAHRRITANTCLLVFAIGLRITYGNYDYLTALSKNVGASQQWSGLSHVPESLIQDGQYGKQIKLKEGTHSSLTLRQDY